MCVFFVSTSFSPISGILRTFGPPQMDDIKIYKFNDFVCFEDLEVSEGKFEQI
jgi:hypothetical protein